MSREHRTNLGHRAPALLTGALVAFAWGPFASPAQVGAAASSEISGGAYGHYTSVGLFGGPPGANGPAPVATLPPTGSERPLVSTEPSAQAVFGPAKVFGGRWPDGLADAPPSGPIRVTTKGRAGPNPSVTSTASIVLHAKPMPFQCDGQPAGSTNCTAPGGWGPNPPTEGDELHSTCTADENGATGSTRLVNAVLATATDPDGNPINEEPVPDNPPVNYERTGVLTNVGDRFRIVYNEQIRDPNGSITVNAVHMFLLGPIAKGEQILGQVRCSTTGPAPLTPTAAQATAAPSPTEPVEESAPAEATSESSESSGSGLPVVPLAVGGGALAAGAAGLAVWARRRRRPGGDQTLNETS